MSPHALAVDTQWIRVGGDRMCRVVSVDGEIDIESVATLLDAVRDEPGHETAAVIVDLSRVTFCGSVGLRALLDLQDRAEPAGVPLELVIASATLHRQLNVLGDLERLSHHPDRDAAQAALGMTPEPQA